MGKAWYMLFHYRRKSNYFVSDRDQQITILKGSKRVAWDLPARESGHKPHSPA